MQRNAKILLAGTLGFLVFCGAVIAGILGVLLSHPDFTKLRSKVLVPIKLADETKSTKWMGPKAPGWVPMKQISNHLLMAVIADEDTSFFSHNGIDMHEMREALKKDLEEKRWARGASTITQQVVKNVWLTQEKTLTRKIRELLWARQLDGALSKSEVLCFYVNMAEWGPGIYGIGEASHHYFDKAPADLTPKESAFLAVLLPSPVRFHTYYTRKKLTPWVKGRIEHVLRVMNRMGFLEDAEYDEARKEALWGIADNASLPTEDKDEKSQEDDQLPADGAFSRPDSPDGGAPSDAAPSPAPEASPPG